MRVTKSRRSEITRLVTFLNLDFKTATEENLKEASLDFCEGRATDWRNACQRLQEQIRVDLIPLIGEQPHLGLDCLDSLLDKISRLNLHFRWSAESTRHQESMRSLGPERRVLKLAGQKFIVCRQLSTFESFRELFYGAIVESLENGAFSRLRLCPTCGKFFLTADVRTRFCPGTSCKDEFHSKTANERVKKFRRRKKRLAAKMGLATLSRLADSLKRTKPKTRVDAIDKVKELVTLKHAMGQRWEKFEPRVDEMIEGKKPDQVWRNLPAGIKEILASAEPDSSHVKAQMGRT
jgi:hypothetical protein